MQDDWDLDYTYTPNYESYDFDEIYESYMQSFDELDWDDEYERETQDYNALAYRHYAWYNVYLCTYLTCLHTLSHTSVWWEWHLT